MNSRTMIRMTISALLILLAWPAAAQELGEVVEQYRHDLDALRDFSWKSSVRFSIDGQLSSTELYEIRYGEDGRLQKTKIAEPEGKAGKSQKTAEVTLSKVRDLLDAYTQLEPATFEKMFGSDTLVFRRDEGDGLRRITARDILHVGDTVEVWVDSADHRMDKIEITSNLQKQPVHLVAEFDALQSGVGYVARSTFETTQGKKKLVIETKNYDFERRGE